jgi:hypothetical protein
MRLDQLPRSDKVEDRRGEGPGGFPMGRAGGLGIGHHHPPRSRRLGTGHQLY